MSDREPIAGRYIPIERVGTGGMGVVYRARDSEKGIDVAIKVMREDRPELSARFEREVDLLRKVEHPAVVRYQGHGKTEHGRPYLVMDWVEGPTLRQQLDELGLTPAESIALAVRLAGALDSAHRAGLVHRDVKPSNVVLCAGDVETAILIDFGLARMTDASDGLTRSGVALGTPGYMAPEQALGRTSLDGRTDIFALGCVLYECLAGVAPFSGLHRTAILSKIVLSPHSPLSSVASVPEELAHLLDLMLAKRVDDRIADCSSIASQLLGLAPIDTDVRAPAIEVAVPEPLEATADDSSLAFIAIAAPPPGTQVPMRTPVEVDSICLVDGASVFVTSATAGAADRAARWALDTRRLNPSVSVSIIAAPVDRGVVSAAAVDRATGALLGTSLQDAFAVTEEAIEMDDATAARLSAGFETTVVGKRILLTGHRSE